MNDQSPATIIREEVARIDGIFRGLFAADALKVPDFVQTAGIPWPVFSPASKTSDRLLKVASDLETAPSALTPTEIEADKNAAEGRALHIDPAAMREGVTRCLSPDDQATIRQALRDINAGVPTACAVQVCALTDKIVGILGRQVERDGMPPAPSCTFWSLSGVPRPPEQVIITEHPQPRVDPLVYHRILDEVATTIGRERTEALRATLPRR